MAEAGAVHRRYGRGELLEEARRERLRDAAVGRALDQREEVGPADELPLFFFRKKKEEEEKTVSGKREGDKGVKGFKAAASAASHLPRAGGTPSSLRTRCTQSSRRGPQLARQREGARGEKGFQS